MRLLDNMSVRMSWTLVLLVFMGLLMVLSGVGLYAVNHSQRSLEAFNAINVNQQATLNRTNSTLQAARLEMARLYEATIEPQTALSSAERQARAQEAAEALASAADAMADFLALPAESAHESLIAPIAENFDALMNETLLPQAEALAGGDSDVYRTLRPEAYDQYRDFYQAAIGFFHTVEAEGNARTVNFEWVVDTARLAIIAVFLTALITACLVFWGVGANLIRPLDRIIEHFQRMAKGDLGAEIEPRGRNEIGKLYAALRDMQRGLSTTVTTVRDSSGEILSSAREIASGNQDLADRTERQSASLTETASSMEEMTSTMERNSENAAQASHMAREAAGRAQQGNEVVDNVVARMHEIRQGSQQITEIIGLIDSIAFQTNILALNASVEAARAGEHGRGFAVVASEVRQLATRSADAATDIRQLIETSVEQIAAGTQQADTASSTMSEIMASVQRVNDLMDEIAVASREQRSGISEVNAAVGDMDQTTQQNAALVQQASGAANQLQSEAQRLTEAVAKFQLAAHGQPSLTETNADPRPNHRPATRTPAAPAQERRDAEWETF
ncbi:HAMP domain-containing protein [Halomonas campisalis]|uniref:HAMP domain-containing protein n=1 Tax=Billgrantia campisalis TaxID=74661 RepID=A0ABS9PC92_9GAMM|nr:methyl-accepting chemotaxis protein [Halomonas campisalis]MCG6658710.1 HAMP domain-containing protein [Halomonas campisalis]MDR5864025.1 methyl-accepting chemotaxis protein [Halomonas campisalis]